MQSPQRGRIPGIGGVFFKSANHAQMREWYSKHLWTSLTKVKADASMARTSGRQ
jgi:hypothetical protein